MRLKCRPLATALVVLLAASSPLRAQESADERFSGVADYIRQAVEEKDVPSIAVAVAEDGEIVWAEAFGWANLDRHIPARVHTMYSLASISKPMTATGLMRLVEQGRVELDRPANDYLGEAKLHSPKWDPTAATVGRVLSHTAGLPLHWAFFYEGECHPPRTTDEAIARYGVLVTPPGEVYQYSNLGYGIIGRIIERVSGGDYAEFMRTEVFEPLGMTRTTVSTGAGLGNRAAVRYNDENEPIPFYGFDHRGASAVYSSVLDLIRFGMFQLGHVGDDQQAILEDSTRMAMQQLATPTGPREQGYGFGWLVQNDFYGYRRIAHTGGMPGVSTGLYLFPEEDVAIAVLANTSTAVRARAAHKIAKIVLPGYGATFEARRAAGADRSPAAGDTAYSPRLELTGTWTGEMHTYEGTVPLTLVVQPGGEVRTRIGDGLVTLLNDVSYLDGRLTGRFAGTIPTEDARRHLHTVLLDLRRHGDRLIGAATAYSPWYFALTSFVAMQKDAGAN